jgi:tryptophan halogenase
MKNEPIGRVVIVGGGTAGWMAAAAAARFLDDGQRTITLVESEDIGTVGVGEATIPPILGFNRLVGIDEQTFLQATGGTYKLGIEFVGWNQEGDRYFHPFGAHGRSFEGINFHQIWLKLRSRSGVGGIGDYSVADVAASQHRFAHPVDDPRSPLSGLAYAYHFDAARYARLLREQAMTQGVARLEGRIVTVDRDSSTGHLTAVHLEDGRTVEGDLFIDCSGFRSLLIGEAMNVPFEDWSHWLPCDRALTVPTARTEPVVPFTRATAQPAGWQWRIPLQHRTGNGHVYASGFMDDAEAERLLLADLDATPMAEPRLLRFTAGRRSQSWEGNVVALGLAGGFLEPLESTSIHIVQEGISKLLALFPDKRFTPIEQKQFNRFMEGTYTSIRDFIILHYHATRRRNSAFWRYVSDMDIPESLVERVELFRDKGRVFRYDDELFAVPNWVAVMIGQNVMPDGYDPIVDALDENRLLAALHHMRTVNSAAASAMPKHVDVLRKLDVPRRQR